MHIMKQTECAILIQVVSLRSENENRCELRITPKSANTIDNVTEVYGKGLASNDHFLALETGSRSRELSVNYLVEFLHIPEREAEFVDQLFRE